MSSRFPHGFTLVELLLSIGIIGLLVGTALPVYASLATRNDLDLATQGIANALRRAEAYARGTNGDSQWGVALQSGQAVLFKGATYATRTTGFEETVAIPGTVTAGGLSEVDFAKLSGLPIATGGIVLTSSALNESRTITINAKGMVDY